MITLEPGMAEWCKEHSVNMSGFCRMKLNELREKYERMEMIEWMAIVWTVEHSAVVYFQRQAIRSSVQKNVVMNSWNTFWRKRMKLEIFDYFKHKKAEAEQKVKEYEEMKRLVEKKEW